eukprot:2538009-Pyramimonas_sp.AAC.1
MQPGGFRRGSGGGQEGFRRGSGEGWEGFRRRSGGVKEGLGLSAELSMADAFFSKGTSYEGSNAPRALKRIASATVLDPL